MKAARSCDELGVCQNCKPVCSDCIEKPAQQAHVSPTCNELGLCQSQFGRPRCAGCDAPLKQLAPGVVEGPYHRETKTRKAMRRATNAMRGLRAYLRGTKP